MSRGQARFLIGTSGWSYPHWRGSFYPTEWPKSRWFDYYAQVFRTVEVNATFYRRFKDTTYRKWRDRAPDGFVYVLKVPGFITHRKHLKDADAEIVSFWESAALLGGKLGHVLLQLSPRTPYDLTRLRSALVAFADPGRVAVEFRDARWLTEDTKELLAQLGSVFCSADSPKTRLLDWVTSDAAYIRLHGRTEWYRYNYSPREIEEIADLARRMAELGARTVYVFFNNDFEAHAPSNARALAEVLGAQH